MILLRLPKNVYFKFYSSTHTIDIHQNLIKMTIANPLFANPEQ